MVLIHLGGGAPGVPGTTTDFLDPYPRYRNAMNIDLPSRLHDNRGASPRRAAPYPTLAFSHTVIGLPPSVGIANAIVLRSPWLPGGVTPTMAQRPSGETLWSCMIGISETAL